LILKYNNLRSYEINKYFNYKVILNMEITSTYDSRAQFLCSYEKNEYF